MFIFDPCFRRFFLQILCKKNDKYQIYHEHWVTCMMFFSQKKRKLIKKQIYFWYFGQQCLIKIHLRRTGGCSSIPLRFFAYVSKNASAEHRRVWQACSYIFSAHAQILDPGYSRSGHQDTTSDLTSEKVWMHVIATPNDRTLWNIQWLISVLVSIKCLSRNFDIGDLSSCQFCDHSIISNGEKWKASLLDENH